MAADIEQALNESADLIQSSGGVFEIEDRGTLIFSKKAIGRFPQEGEVISIVRAVDSGTPLVEAQRAAGANAAKPVSFVEWFKVKFSRN